MILYSLKRIVNKNTRYYNIMFEKSLFNETIIEINYGNICYKSPTKILKKYFESENLALKYVNYIVRKKLKKGYY